MFEPTLAGEKLNCKYKPCHLISLTANINITLSYALLPIKFCNIVKTNVYCTILYLHHFHWVVSHSRNCSGLETSCRMDRNIVRIAKRCPDYISKVVKVSSCSYQKNFWFVLKLSIDRVWYSSFVIILSFKFLQNLNGKVLSQFNFFEFLYRFEFLSLLLYLLLSFVTIWVLSQYEILGFVQIRVFEVCCFFSFYVLSQFELLVLSQFQFLIFCRNLS